MSRDGLLRAIVAAPEDDTVRLAFADWLEEKGDEVDCAHAELIRWQIELACLPADDDRRAELEALQARWRSPGNDHIRQRLQVPACVGRATSRGFPDRVGFDWNNLRKGRLSGDDLAEMAEAAGRLPIRMFAGDLLGRGAPVAGGTRLDRGGLELLADWPVLSRLTALEATSGVTPLDDRGDFTPGLRALAASPHASGLRRLRLGEWQVDQRVMEVVGSSPYLSRLTELAINVDPYDAEKMADILASLLVTPLAGRLEWLSCAWANIPAVTIRGWLDRAPLRALAFGVPEGDDGIGPLLGARGLAGLRELTITGERHGFDVDQMPLEDDHRVIPHLTELFTSAGLAGLETLSLRGIALGDGGAHALAAAPLAGSLVELDLRLCGLTGAGLRALRPLLTRGRLRRLSLGHNDLTRADAEDMASWPELSRLHRLDVGYFNGMGDAGRGALEGSRHRHPFLEVE